MEENKFLKKSHIILIIIGSLFVLLSIFHENLWFDEAYSVGMADQSLIEIWKIGRHDVHPILYYFALRIIKILTSGRIISYRIFSSIPIILLGILGLSHIKKDFGVKTGIIFSFLSYFLPIMIIYTNEIRMYSWSAYIIAVYTIYLYRIYKKENKFSNWIIFGTTAFFSIYLHYYGLLYVIITNIILLIYFIKKKRLKDLKKQVVINILLFISYIPWIINMFLQIKHVAKGFWIGFKFPETIIELLGFQLSGNLKMYIGFFLNILLIIYIILMMNKRNKYDKKIIINCITIYLLVIITSVIISLVLKTSIIYPRYLFILIGIYIFVISYLISKENNKHIIIMCVIVFVMGVANNIIQIKNNYAIENGKHIDYLNENIRKGDVIVYMDNEIGSVFAINFKNNKQYFYNPENWGIVEAYKVWSPQMETYITTDFLSNCTDRVWIIDSKDNNLYNKIFNNTDFKYISSKCFETRYQNYIYNIILVQKIS